MCYLKLIASFLIFINTLHPLYAEVTIEVDEYNAYYLQDIIQTPITLEYARTAEEIAWGLMKRSYLPDNHGLIFEYPSPQKVHLWMFNCYIDLSVAYLDSQRVIRELDDLKAYPERMDPCRPVDTLNDILQYPPYDSVITYFKTHGSVSKICAHYVLEMNSRWFQENGVRIGDVVRWNEEETMEYIVHTSNVSLFVPCEEVPIVITYPGDTAQAIWMPYQKGIFDVAFLDGEKCVVKVSSLMGGKNMALEYKPVIYSDGPVKYILIASEGYLKKKDIALNTHLDFGCSQGEID